MEVKGTVLSGLHKSPETRLNIGSLVRVQVNERLNHRYVLVSFGGRRHLARLSGTLPGNLFIAQVQKLKPRIELRLVKNLGRQERQLNPRIFDELKQGKKSFIHRLFGTDNFLKALSVPVKEDRRTIRESLRRSIARRNLVIRDLTSRGVGQSLAGEGPMTEHLILEALHNFFNPDSLFFMLPIYDGQKHRAAELKIAGNREGRGDGFFLKIHLEDEERITFLVYIDFDVINCTLSTNNPDIEKILKTKAGILISGLKSLKYDREVVVRFTPYREEDFTQFSSLKKIDVKM
jgi:hypothetical protein